VCFFQAVQDGYRDVKVFVVFDLHAGNEDEKKMAIVGEIQVMIDFLSDVLGWAGF